MQKNTLEKVKVEVKRLAESSDPRVIAFVRKMHERYPELAR
jgi:hypothetical protein